jgi:hypothetical protein
MDSPTVFDVLGLSELVGKDGAMNEGGKTKKE